MPGEGLVMLLAARLSREYSREEENVVYNTAPAFTRLLSERCSRGKTVKEIVHLRKNAKFGFKKPLFPF